MKRKIALLMAGTMLVLAGCGNKGNVTETPAPTDSGSQTEETTEEKDASTEESTETSAEETTTEDTTAAAENVYSNDYFQITIPSDLVDVVSVETSNDRIDIYHKDSKDAGFGGLEMSIWAVPLPREYAGGPYEKCGELSNENADILELVRGYATEIQWDYNLEKMPEDFEKLDKAADEILSSVTGINGYTYNAGAGMKGEDLYNNVLAKYVRAMNEEWDASKCEQEQMSPELNYEMLSYDGGNPLDKIGYAYRDINSDGIDELFVGPMGIEDFDDVTYDVYTMIDDKPTFVISGSARNRFYDYDNNFLCNVGSGGAGQTVYDVYALMNNSTELVYQFGYKYDSYENEEKPWFKTYDQMEYEPVTEDEFNEETERLEKGFEKLDFKPLSGNSDAIGLAEYGASSGSSEAALPAYEYPGPELFYTVLYKCIADEFGQEYQPADVGIPSPVIVAVDESDKNDIKVYGDFWYYNYTLNGDTLETANGGSYPGCIHIKSTDEGYEVVKTRIVEDGSNFDDSAKEIFGDYYDDFMKAHSDQELADKTRAQIIANYVAANNLAIKQYQDFGWDPVALPEENIDNFYSILD